jgi:predicted small lipoprotein YifL
MTALLASFGLAGCGVKGQLEKPAGGPADKPGPDGKKPHRPFVLDGLL